MNIWNGIGRLCTQPEIRIAVGEKQTAIANFRIAVDRRGRKNEADFFNCTAFGKTAEFVEKYINKGMKVGLVCHIQNDQYTNRDGQKVFSTVFIVDSIEFCEKKENLSELEKEQNKAADEFMSIDNEELPFNF